MRTMARKIWSGEEADVWFALSRKKAKAPARKGKPTAAGRSTSRPLGLVEAHRKAMREKRVLKP